MALPAWPPMSFARLTSRPLFAVVLMVACTSACLPRTRFNKACEWTGDSERRLDMRLSSDQQHLIEDAQLAEELAVRYADFRHTEPYGYEGHGGLLEHGKVGNDCLAKLDGVIKRSHGVTQSEITVARRHRDRAFDVAVVVSFWALFALAATWFARALLTYSGSDRSIWVATTTVSSMAVAAAAVQLLSMWATVAEIVRIGNDHLGPQRGGLIPWDHHIGGVFVAAMCGFFVIASVQRWRGPVDIERSPDAADPRSVFLR